MNPLNKISFGKQVAFVLIPLGFLIYANALLSPFILDDFALVTHNTDIQSWSTFGQLFSGNVVAESSFYRPLQMMTYLFDHTIWGLNPKGFHLTSVAIHILVSLSLCWAIFVLTQNKVVSFLTAVLFLVHPIHNEAVVYISGRADPLAALFLLLTFVFYLKNQQERRPINEALAVTSFLLAILSKEYALILPLLLLGYHFAFRKKIDRRLWGALSVIVIGFIILRVSGYLGVVDMHLMAQTTLMQRLPAAFDAMIQYIRLLFIPYNLSMGYGQKITSFASPACLAGIVFTIGSMTMAVRIRRNNAVISFALLWYFIGLLPVMNIYPVNAYMAEHWLYVPSMGVFLIAALALEKLYSNARIRKIAVSVSVVIIAALSFCTVLQNQVWHDPSQFYQRIVRINPAYFKAYNNLGKLSAEAGHCPQAIRYFDKAIKVEPRYIMAINNAAVCYERLGEKDKAAEYYHKILTVRPGNAPTHYYLGVLAGEQGNDLEAVRYLRDAISYDPQHIKATTRLGVVYARLGELQQSETMFRRSLSLDPTKASAYSNLGSILLRQGRVEDAIKYYKIALDIEPSHQNAIKNLQRAQTLIKQGQ